MEKEGEALGFEVEGGGVFHLGADVRLTYEKGLKRLSHMQELSCCRKDCRLQIADCVFLGLVGKMV